MWDCGERPKVKRAPSERIYQYVITTFILVLCIACVYPLTYVIALSLTSEKEWVDTGGFLLWPRAPTIRGYVNVIIRTPVFLNSFPVSVGRVAVGTPCILLFTMIMGYVLSKRRLPGKQTLIMLVLITILFPGGLIPTYLVVSGVGLLNKFPVFFVPLLIDSWGVLVFKQFFGNTPREIEEAAYMDGVGELRLMVSIIVPMSTAVIAAWSLFIAVAQWNAWFDALIYIRNQYLMPLQLIMVNLFSQSLGFDMNFQTGEMVNRVSLMSLRMAITVLATVPILIVYPFLQKYFVSGVYLGSVKG